METFTADTRWAEPPGWSLVHLADPHTSKYLCFSELWRALRESPGSSPCLYLTCSLRGYQASRTGARGRSPKSCSPAHTSGMSQPPGQPQTLKTIQGNLGEIEVDVSAWQGPLGHSAAVPSQWGWSGERITGCSNSYMQGRGRGEERLPQGDSLETAWGRSFLFST